MPGAVIFDFDGVIADSELLHFRAFNLVLAKHGVEITKSDYYRDYLGLTDFSLLEMLAQKGLLKADENEIADLVLQKKTVFEELAESGCVIIDGVVDFLETLKSNNVPIAICSGAILNDIDLVLKQSSLEHFFEVIVTAEDVVRGKPFPDGFLLSLKKLNEKNGSSIQPNQCIVIEDSHWGLEAATAAQMHTVAVANSYDADQLTMAEMVVQRLNELSMDDLKSLCS